MLSTTSFKQVFIIVFACLNFTLFAKEHRFLLITGCGRSGTAYMTEFLTASGLDVKHEFMGADGSVSWLLAAKSDWAPWGPLRKKYRFDHVFHQVRDPIKVIQSFYNFPPKATWEWICEVIPEINLKDSDLTKCAKYWLYWNLMAEAGAEWTYRIENFDTEYKVMGKKLGIAFDENVLKSIPKNTNTRGAPPRLITWDILKKELDPLLYNQVHALALRYGYIVVY